MMIFNIFANLESKADVETLLPLLFSVEEMSAVNSRALIYKELLLGNLSQREIAKVHNISIATITRGSNNLKQMNESERKFLQKLLIGN